MVCDHVGATLGGWAVGSPKEDEDSFGANAAILARLQTKDEGKAFPHRFLLIHGKADKTVGCVHSERILEALLADGKVEATRIVTCFPTKMEHNSPLFSDVAFFVAPYRRLFGVPRGFSEDEFFS